MRKAIFLDRDGIVNLFPGEDQFVLSWDQFHFTPGIRDVLRAFRADGYFLSLATNQSGVGRGLMTLETLHAIHAAMQRELGPDALDAIYYCPHHPSAGCVCRKPSPHLILQACADHGLDPRQSVMLGDSNRDIEMGAAAGCTTILCRDPLPARDTLKPQHRPDQMFTTVPAAAAWILNRARA